MQRSNSRRRLLSVTGSIVLATLAGCSGVLGGDPENDDADGEPANESDGDAGGNASDGGGSDGDSADGDGSSPTEDGDDAADDETPPMPEPVDWTDEERGTISVGPGGEFVFDPDAVRVEPGTLVRWLWESDFHNVVPVDRPDGADWDGETETYDQGHSYEFTFETPGTYEYVCEPHEGAGMRGYVVVSDDQQ
ncbi:plastocyanin/azurin family copper-binding protein [Natronoarchaeum mannanilyticum]|uniref:plastocyanin/azurin family copper-binding protein n=1 Tax=Natronoarchaeum mannanilyticum TaxID=926360 RepID=UPI003606B044